MRRTAIPAAAMLSAALSASAAMAEPLIVAELFTSQSCSSCPPAEAYFRKLSARPGVLALEWHVDYWDRLPTADGAWKDPFSSPANTARQRAYNVSIRGTGGVYTPQAIINGATETVGSDARRVDSLIAAARAPQGATLNIVAADGALRADASGLAPTAALLLVRFRKQANTAVRGGENAGKALASANVVTHAETISSGQRFAPPAPGEGCAVLAQNGIAGAISAAALCPA